MYHQSRVSGKSEAAFVIRRRAHNALSIIAEPLLLCRNAENDSIQFPVSVLVLKQRNGIRTRR